MEGLIIFIVLIVLFNVINIATRVARRSQAASKTRQIEGGARVPQELLEDVPVDETVLARLLPQKQSGIDPFDFDDSRAQQRLRSVPTSAAWEEQDEGIRQAAKHGRKEKPEPERQKRPSPSTQTQTSRAPRRLSYIFRESDTLLGAFIFHEVMQPPVTRRRR